MAVKFAETMDPDEVLEWVIPVSSILETGETIDPDDDRWSLNLLAEAISFGLEIITDDPTWPDPYLMTGDPRWPDYTAIRFWARVKAGFLNNPAFVAGVDLPMAITGWTSSVPPRRRQRTAIMTVVEK